MSLLFQNTSPEDLEKKRANSSAYRNYLNREGPRALGSKEIPQVKTPKQLKGYHLIAIYDYLLGISLYLSFKLLEQCYVCVLGSRELPGGLCVCVDRCVRVYGEG